MDNERTIGELVWGEANEGGANELVVGVGNGANARRRYEVYTDDLTPATREPEPELRWVDGWGLWEEHAEACQWPEGCAEYDASWVRQDYWAWASGKGASRPRGTVVLCQPHWMNRGAIDLTTPRYGDAEPLDAEPLDTAEDEDDLCPEGDCRDCDAKRAEVRDTELYQRAARVVWNAPVMATTTAAPLIWTTATAAEPWPAIPPITIQTQRRV